MLKLKAIASVLGLIILWWLAYPTASEFFYDGDGEFSVSGTWPLLTYKLIMPQFNLSDRHEYTYRVSNYSTDGGDHLRLCFEMDEPFDYLSVGTHASLTVVGADGVRIIAVNEPLNDPDRFSNITEPEYRVMQAEGFGQWRAGRSESRIIRSTECFSASWTQLGWRLNFNWWEDYEVQVQLTDVDPILANARVHVEISKGWK